MPCPSALLEHVRTTPLEELDDVFKLLADRLHAHRQTHSGLTPRPIFVSAVEIGGSYPCVEVVPFITDGNGKIVGTMLKRRDRKDQGWEGMKTIPGGTLKSMEMLTQLQWRVIDEITSDPVLRTTIADQIMSSPAFIEVHREDTDPKVEGRRVNCMTGVYPVMLNQANLPEGSFQEGFVFVRCDQFDDLSIVDHHRSTLSALYALTKKL